MTVRFAPAARLLAVALVLGVIAVPASAQVEGRFRGASSVAGGSGECWGNAPADATVAGGALTIRYVAYDGTDSTVQATVGKDGGFTATTALKSGGTLSYSGKVTARGVTATWKGPACYGTLDLSR